jgi:hypothetical protein
MDAARHSHFLIGLSSQNTKRSAGARSAAANAVFTRRAPFATRYNFILKSTPI